MSTTLSKISARYATHPRARTAVEIALRESAYLRAMERSSAFRLGTTEHHFRIYEGTMPVETREINNPFSATITQPPPLQTGTLAIQGYRLQVDDTYIDDQSLRGPSTAGHEAGGIEGWFDEHFPPCVISWIEDYESLLFNGDGVAGNLLGLKNILTGAPLQGLGTETGVVDATEANGFTTDSLDLSDENNWEAAVNLLKYYSDQMRGKYRMFASPAMVSKLTTIARKDHSWGEGMDKFGFDIQRFRGTEVVKLLPQTIQSTEPDNASTPVNETESIYLIAAGEGQYTLTTNSGIKHRDLDDTNDKSAKEIIGEVRMRHTVQSSRRILRIRNLKINA